MTFSYLQLYSWNLYLINNVDDINVFLGSKMLNSHNLHMCSRNVDSSLSDTFYQFRIEKLSLSINISVSKLRFVFILLCFIFKLTVFKDKSLSFFLLICKKYCADFFVFINKKEIFGAVLGPTQTSIKIFLFFKGENDGWRFNDL